MLCAIAARRGLARIRTLQGAGGEFLSRQKPQRVCGEVDMKIKHKTTS